MDIYEVFLHGEPVILQLSDEDAERLGVRPRHSDSRESEPSEQEAPRRGSRGE